MTGKIDTSLIDEAQQVEDQSEEEIVVAPIRYEISSYGADYDVEGLVKRLNRGDILVPPFQRNYVWNQAEASRFIESLLLGLPVPAIFLAKEPESNKLLVIDGQQRLKSLQFFFNGFFNPKDDEETKRVFKLMKVRSDFEGLTYGSLSEKDQIKLNDSLIHAIVIKQESPDNDDTSIYHIFDRLNSEGRSLTPQEIRTAIDHGKFIELIKELNEYQPWRDIYGKANSRLKDQELILRFLAFFFERKNYERPMKEFLNKFSHGKRNSSDSFLNRAKRVFISTIDVVSESIGKDAFRPKRAINAAVFDSVMVGIAQRIEKGTVLDRGKIRAAHNELLEDTKYLLLIAQSTSAESNVEERFSLAIEKFDAI